MANGSIILARHLLNAGADKDTVGAVSHLGYSLSRISVEELNE